MDKTPKTGPLSLEGIGWPATAKAEDGRLDRIHAELRRGFASLHDVEPAIAFFGSARSEPDAPECVLAREVAEETARIGFNIITGGGPGVMEAANRGCREAGGLSVGLNIELPFEQRLNRYVDRSCAFRYFFVRKLMFVKYSCAFLIFPGGFGTLDEAFEALTLVQTHKIPHFPVLLFGDSFWDGMITQLDTMQERGFIDAEERKQIRPVASAAEAIPILRHCHEGLCAQLGKPALRSRILPARPKSPDPRDLI
jgi:uncharacterized protein (TIGR00730 family)